MEENKNPWLGLNTYTEQDRLYGRDKESREVADIILNNLSTVIYGRSGIGKSSLLRAGVFPLMRYEDILPVYVRLEHNATTKYIDQIHHKIKVAAKNANLSISPKEDEKIDSLRELLCHYAFKDELTHIPKHLMLVFDQFEEIFTLAGASYNNDVQGFFSELASVLNDTTTANGDCGLFRIVICLREDCLYFLEQVSSDIPSLKRNRYRLTALSHEQGLDVICKPRPDLVNKETAEAILAKIDVKNKGEIDPAILSLFMHELYEKGDGVITQENIKLYGDNIIVNFYQDGIGKIGDAFAAYLERRLVSTDGYRLPLPKADALSEGEGSYLELKILKDKRIIVIEKDERNREIIELSHDVLCPIVLKSRYERRYKEEKERLDAEEDAAKKREFRTNILFLLLIVAFLIFKGTKDTSMNKQITRLSEYAIALENICNDFCQKKSDYISFSPDGEKAIRTFGNEAVIWDVKTGRGLKHLEALYDINYAFFSPDGKEVLAVSGLTATVWNMLSGDCIFLWHKDIVNSAQYSPNGEKIITASDDSTAIVWNPKTGEDLFILKGHKGHVNYAQFSSDGEKIVTVSDDGTIIVWSADTGQYLYLLLKDCMW